MDISLIIATRNRAELLEETLEYLAAVVVRNADWEVVVVDNGSEDETLAVVEAAKAFLPVIALSVPEPGQNRARNRALEIAKGDFIVFTDDDVIPDRNWLAELLAGAERWPDHNIFCGPIIPKFPSGIPDWLKNLESIVKFQPQEHEGPLPGKIVPFSPNMAFRRKVFEKVRFSEQIGPAGPNYAMGSETELLRRLRAAGETPVFLPEAKVQHVIQEYQMDLSWLLGRKFRAGRGLTRLMPDLTSPRLLGAPRWLWPKLARAGLAYLFAAPTGVRRRFRAAQQFHYLRGAIFEYWRLAEEAGREQVSQLTLAHPAAVLKNGVQPQFALSTKPERVGEFASDESLSQ
jgi:glycosyltransferase involved in cell wall biosynthesis